MAPPAAITTSSWSAANGWASVRATTVPLPLAAPTGVTGLGGPEELEDTAADDDDTAALLEGAAEEAVVVDEETPAAEEEVTTVEVAPVEELLRGPLAEEAPREDEAIPEEVVACELPAAEDEPTLLAPDTPPLEAAWLLPTDAPLDAPPEDEDEEAETAFPDEEVPAENVTQ